jgi:osmoprotectant transport system substrate-binding protein
MIAAMLKRLIIAAMLAALAVPMPGRAADSVVVSSKIDTEGALLGSMILVLLRHHGIEARNRLQLGPTEIVRHAILAGEIDLYPEYTGNGAYFFKREADPAWRDAARGYDTVKALDRAANDLIWLGAAPANNTWAIALRGDVASAQHLESLEDFARYVDAGGAVRLAASAEFVNAPGGLMSFEKQYGFRLRRDQLLTLAGGNTAATIRAAAENISRVNAAMAYGTDGALSVLGLVALADDRGAQMVYRPAPVVRGVVLKAHPEIEAILDPVFASLTLEKLQSLNAKISVEGLDAEKVASDYLAASSFLAK